MWERQFCNMERTQCVLVFVIAFLYMIKAVPICPEYKFYDHGTDHCEECREICDKAEFMGTVDMCWKNCPAYARIIWPPKDPGIPAPTAYPSLDPPTSQINGKIAAYVVVPVGLLCIVITAFLAYKKRHTIMDKLQRGRRRRDGDVDEIQQGQEMILLDPNNLERRGDGEEERGAGEGSLAASGVSTSTSGVQEQGEAVGSPNGEMPFYRIPTGAKYVPPPSPQQPASVNDCKYPTQESVSQQEGPTALAAANDQFHLSEIPAVQVQMSDLQMPPSLHEDLHSTELKTFEPSLSHSTTFTGAGAMDDMPSTKI